MDWKHRKLAQIQASIAKSGIFSETAPENAAFSCV